MVGGAFQSQRTRGKPMKTKLQDILPIEHPIIQGPFGGLSTVALVSAVSNAGGMGSFGAYMSTPQEISSLVAEIKTKTKHPFALNLWVPQAGEPKQITQEILARSQEILRPFWSILGKTAETDPLPIQNFEEQVRALLHAAPPVMSFVMGIPPAWVIEEAKQKKIVIIGTATTVEEALALERAGVDIVVASGSDAGGHRSSFLRPASESLVGTFSLIPQVVDAVKIPVIAAGGIADARGIRAARALGADGVQIGTAFLACEESGASEAHRGALASPEARYTILTRVFSGRLARGIINRFVREMLPFENEIPAFPIQNALTQPLRKAAANQGERDLLALWAGQAASLTRRTTAAQLMKQLTLSQD
jgi:nitronate monooxygenase